LIYRGRPDAGRSTGEIPQLNMPYSGWTCHGRHGLYPHRGPITVSPVIPVLHLEEMTGIWEIYRDRVTRRRSPVIPAIVVSTGGVPTVLSHY
jgi:hypothetical protein